MGMGSASTWQESAGASLARLAIALQPHHNARLDKGACFALACPRCSQSGGPGMNAALAGIADAECAVAANFRAGALKPFRVTVSVVGQPAEQINILSRTSSDAAVQVMHLLFSDADDCGAANFRLRVEAIRA